MKILHQSFLVTLYLMAVILLTGCISETVNPKSRQIEAINCIRELLNLPDIPLEFIETTNMINSPDGDLQVSLYEDSDGRKYYVDPQTNQVVEIDARAILVSISPNTPYLSQDELSAKAEGYIKATTPNFASRQNELSFNESNKNENYFFDWTDTSSSGSLNRIFAQIGFHASGVLFAYYNTLSLK